MNTITIILVLIVLIVILSSVIYALIRDRKILKKEITQITSELYKSNQNSLELADYIKKIQNIKSEETATAIKIEEAESDEEIIDIVNSIIAINNSRVQNRS